MVFYGLHSCNFYCPRKDWDKTLLVRQISFFKTFLVHHPSKSAHITDLQGCQRVTGIVLEVATDHFDST